MSKAYRDFHRKRRGRLITRLMKRDGTRCMICDGSLDRSIDEPSHIGYITLDHIITRSAGGLDHEANLRLAHRLCNEQRGNDPIMPGHEPL